MSASLQRLRKLLRPEQLLLGAEQLAAYQSDGLTAFHQLPLAIVIPETTDEVVALIKGRPPRSRILLLTRVKTG